MPVINKSAVVSYTPEEMYNLVNDIESYPQFVPWCVKSEVINRSEDEIHAMLTFSRSGLQKSFSTINRLQPHKIIEIRLLNGPFKQLEGFWRFESHVNGYCQVVLDLEFEFASRLLAMMFGPVFHQVAVLLVEAFINRAKIVYGNRE